VIPTLGPVKRLLLLLVPVALLAGCSGRAGDDAVVVVNGQEVLQADDFQSQLEEIGDDDDFLTSFDGRGDGPGTLSSAFVATVLSNHVLNELVRQDLDERGVEISDNDRERGAQQLADALGGDVEAAPPAYRELLLDLFAGVVALRRDLHDDDESLQDEVDAIYSDAEVRIDDRYGAWDPDQHQVVPPEGPVTPTTEGPVPATAPTGG